MQEGGEGGGLSYFQWEHLDALVQSRVTADSDDILRISITLKKERIFFLHKGQMRKKICVSSSEHHTMYMYMTTHIIPPKRVTFVFLCILCISKL